MKKPLAKLRFIVFLFVAVFLSGCSDFPPEDVYKILEEKAKVKTFPLTIVLTDPLAGDEFPDDLKALCKFSSAICNTLPTAGLLRLGSDQYFTFNAIASLDVNGHEGDDEASLAQSVQNQVSAWYLKVKLRDFDSLRSANKAEYNSRVVTAEYIQNNKDSIYFYSSNPSDPSITLVGNRSFTVYKDVSALRRIIDEQICKGALSISIFYAPSTKPAGSVASGMYAGDTCVNGSKFEKLNDGKGNLFVGKLIEKNSRSCGFAFPTGVAGDTCINFSKYQKLHDGRGGFKPGNLLEKNSQSCGYIPPKAQAETEVKLPASTQPVRVNAPSTVPASGATQPVRVNAATTRPANAVTPPVRVNAATTGTTRPAGGNSASASTIQPGRVNATPARPVASATKPAAQADETPVAKSAAQITSTDKRCAKISEPMCEQDERGNYTGRRIQYCYNAAGKIVRTTVLAKCDGDCRCLGD